ncbi:methyltransferase domain-containing protein [Novosphingobium sp. 9U]|uniref:methyltransferase domain-containing protein n=1 Tax=Novosphingobium sp. 9U TaxID=2653158 RepID=UPI0012EF8E22|nr:methyltransferase domain-containing protein [Novosphingobium sp. 9U]VWX50883.1 Methylase involved in ubiquinone/menaquinone biosynthesis [Novosphingobium sp. 9U]
MAIRVHDPDALHWRRMGDIPMGSMRSYIDASELEGYICFHEAGTATSMQLMELRLNPNTCIAPHSHDEDEIYFVAEGSLNWEDRSLVAGGSIFLPARVTYSFRTGPEATRLLNFRARADHSFNPAQASDQNARVRDQFSQQAPDYAKLIAAQGAQPRADPLIELMDPQPGDRVLDVGCGSGQLAVTVAPRVAKVVGIDLTPAMLDEARSHAAAAGVENVHWELADSVSLPVDDASFDIVVSRSMLHHAADPARTLAEMRRACTPGGRIIVSDLSPDPAKSAAFDAIELLRDPSHKHALTLGELQALGRELGLVETVVRSSATSLPLESVLATSFPAEGMLDHVRALLGRDAAAGTNALGMTPELREGQLWVTYPMMTIGWKTDG